MVTSQPVRHAGYTGSAAAGRAGWSDIGRCPDGAIAAPLDGHTAGNSFRIPGMANSPFPGAPDRRALRPRSTSAPLVPPTRAPQFPEFVGTVHDLAFPDCRIWRSSPTTKPEFPIFYAGGTEPARKRTAGRCWGLSIHSAPGARP